MSWSSTRRSGPSSDGLRRSPKVTCHRRAFTWFGGVPRTVVPDNLKAAVLRATLHDPVLGEAYRRCAQHYGFTISPTRPRTPEHKGKSLS
ncbi:MAG: DDE-type integrase/transposase/recombinase [Chloroflexota bacterium]